MDRRNFLKSASGMALAATAAMAGLPMNAAPLTNKKNQAPNLWGSEGERLQRRSLGGMNASAIGLGCLPMVGYYGGKFEKAIYADMDAYRRHIHSPHFLCYKQGTLHMVKSLDLVDMRPMNPDAMKEIFIKMRQ